LAKVCAEEEPVRITGDLFPLSGSHPVTDADFLALSCVVAVDGDVNIIENDELESLDGLSALVTIGGDLTIDNNSDLQHVDGLSSLERVGGSLTLGYNTYLNSVRGLSTLRSVAGDLTVNTMSATEASFGDLQTVGGNLTINTGAPTLEFNALEHVDGDLTIEQNSQLQSVELNSLTEVGGDLTFETLYGLEQHGMPSLQRVVGGLDLGSASINEIQGFDSLSQIGSFYVHATNFTSLVFPTLEKVDNDVIITDNLYLPTSEAEAFVDGLESVGGPRPRFSVLPRTSRISNIAFRPSHGGRQSSHLGSRQRNGTLYLRNRW